MPTKVVWDVTISGNSAIPTGEIEDAIATEPSSHFKAFFWGWGEKILDPIALEADRKRIAHLYQRKGYYQASVDRAAVIPCGGPDRVCVDLHVSEGAAARISIVKIKVDDGEPPRSPDELLSVFNMTTGEVFDHDRYLAGKNAVESYLRDRSYPLPELKGEAVYDPRTNEVAISLVVKPGTAARIGFITFDGVDKIRSEDALTRLPIRSGQPYDPRLFTEAQSLLGELDVFRSINVELKPRRGDPELVDVVYRVREKPLRTLQLGAGARVESSRDEIFGRVEWINRNFHGHLRTLDLLFEPRYAVLPSFFNPAQSGPLGTVEASAGQPAFLSPWQDLKTTVGFDADLEQGYAWYGPRFNIDLERRLGGGFNIGGGYTFRYLTFYNVSLGTGATSSALLPPALLFSDNYRLGFLGEHFSWDGRDDVVRPHRGSYVLLGLQEGAKPLASSFTYLRAQPEVRHYFPLARRATLAARALFGRIAEIGDGVTTPITERFYGGGANDHRGFSYHRLSPQTLTTDGRPVPVGGNLEVLFSLENRVDLFTLGDRWLVGAVFFDAGDVVPGPADLDLRELHYAAGTGLRYDTPLGLLRADVGFRLNRLGDSTDGHVNPDPGARLAVHVSFGESF